MAAQAKVISPAIVLQAVDRLSTWTGKTASQIGSQKEVAQVFSALSSYIKHLVMTKQLQNEVVRQAVYSLVMLALEAAARLEKVHGQGVITALAEFQEFHSLYQHKVLPLFPKKPQMTPVRSGKESSSDTISGLDEIKGDLDYELLLIKKEGGASYVSPVVKSHIELLSGLNVLFLEEESFIKKIQCAQDRSCMEIAREILKENTGLIDSFWKEALKFKANLFIQIISKALMALLLANNSRNLMVNTSFKSCSCYYRDFHRYLREAFSPVYVKKMSGEDAGAVVHRAWQLALHLSSSLFLANSPQKEMAHLVTLAIPSQERPIETREIYSDLSKKDSLFRNKMESISSMPLLLAAQMIQEERVGFDPLLMGGPLKQCFRLGLGDLDVSVLHLPSPTYQENIASASCVNEFLGWLESMKSQGRHHLLINLQDRVSWKEYARANALEKMQIDGVLTVVSFDRKTMFYEQSGAYADSIEVDGFFAQCKDQILSESTGFYFPNAVDKREIATFLDQAIPLIHDLFFGNSKNLNVESRQDFIEILSIFLTIKMIELLKADTLSLTDKDGIDGSSAMNTELFAFCKMLSSQEPFSEEEYTSLLLMLYAPALGVRGRLIEERVFQRMSRALVVLGKGLESDRSKALQGIKALYSQIPLYRE